MRIPVAVLISIGCATETRAPPPFEARLPGCYELGSGAWENSAELDRFYPTTQIPRRIRFDTARAVGWDPLQNDSLPLFAVRAVGAMSGPHTPFTYWSRVRVRSDSIHVGVPLPLGGAYLRLATGDDTLVGLLTTSTDALPPVGPSSASLPIKLVPIECPNP
jgi:hypothetical protein